MLAVRRLKHNEKVQLWRKGEEKNVFTFASKILIP